MGLGVSVTDDRNRFVADLGEDDFSVLEDGVPQRPSLFERESGHVTAAFEVEHTTSIYSGIVRLLALALGAAAPELAGLFLVAPADREDEVGAQVRRPAFSRVADLRVRFLPYSELERHRESVARFGSAMKGIDALARTLG